MRTLGAIALLMTALGACSRNEGAAPKETGESAPATAACPDGLTENAARTRALRLLLRHIPEAQRQVERAGDRYLICYGEPVESAVDGKQRLRLRASDSDPVLAARVAHLLTHVVDPIPQLDTAREPCAKWLERVRIREERAHALESRVRERVGLMPLEPAVLARVMAQYQSRCADAGTPRPSR